jgi:RNA polymerase sigma factor (sigma-70 family)
MEIGKKPLIETDEDSDEDLLVIISMKDEIEARKSAFDTFYNRHAGFLWEYIKRTGTYIFSEQEMHDIFNRSFMNVYDYSDSFDLRGESSREIIGKKIRGWLVAIVKTQVKVYLSKGRFIANDEILNYQKMVRASKSSSQPTVSGEILSKALSTLSEREQHILLTYWQFHEPGQGEQSKNMPSVVLESLCDRYETSKANIRQIVHRSYGKVVQFIKTNYPDSLK